jgi:maltooligosyltrehalose synthase
MKVLARAAMATALVGLFAGGTPSGAAAEECETVVADLTEAVSIAHKNFDTTMDELKQTMSQSADDKKKASVKNTFCSAVGELLGASRASRAVAGECGANQRAALAQFDKSIKEIEGAIDSTCK